LTAVLFASFPFFIAAYSIFLLKSEKPNIYAWSGLAVGFSGVVMVFYDSLVTSEFVLLGAVLVVPASAISALGTIVLRVWYNDEDFTLMVCLQSLAGAVVIMAAHISIGRRPPVSGHIRVGSGIYRVLLAFEKNESDNSLIAGLYNTCYRRRSGIPASFGIFSTFTAAGSVLILCRVILVIKK